MTLIYIAILAFIVCSSLAWIGNILDNCIKRIQRLEQSVQELSPKAPLPVRVTFSKMQSTTDGWVSSFEAMPDNSKREGD